MKNRFLLSGIALTFTYAIFDIFQLNHFINTWLRGQYYLPYQIIYLCTIFIAFYFYLKKYTVISKKRYKLIIFGIIAGYFSGLFAAIAELIFIDYGFEILINSMRSFDDLIMLFFGPILVLSWLFGSIMGLIIMVLLKWRNFN